MTGPATVRLWPEQFGAAERALADHGGVAVSAFRYASGVAALRFRMGGDEVVALPFRGQQVWDARLRGRRVTMGSPFDAPRASTDYLSSYGAFLIHCGLTAMGNPGPGDTHPLHGELPACDLDEASLSLGADAEGPWVELRGHTRQTRAFHHDYAAELALRLRPGSGMLEVRIAVTNRAARPLDLMYLAHVNFRPAEGGRLADAVPDSALAVRPRPGDGALPPGSHRALVLADPARHRAIPPMEPGAPEIVLTLRPPSGGDGWAHALQLHPDGSADVVSHRPDELPACVRWIVRDGDMDAAGFALPATGAPDGLTAARDRGEAVRLAPGATWRAGIRAGVLAAAEAAALVRRIEALRTAEGTP